MIYFTAQQKTEEKVTNIQRRGLEYASKEFRELFELYKLWFTLYICTGRNKESSDFKVFITRTSSLYILGKCKETKYDSIHLHSAICSWEIFLCSLCTCSYTLHQTDFSFMSKIITDHESWVSGCDLQSKQEFFYCENPRCSKALRYEICLWVCSPGSHWQNRHPIRHLKKEINEKWTVARGNRNLHNTGSNPAQILTKAIFYNRISANLNQELFIGFNPPIHRTLIAPCTVASITFDSRPISQREAQLK